MSIFFNNNNILHKSQFMNIYSDIIIHDAVKVHCCIRILVGREFLSVSAATGSISVEELKLVGSRS